MYSINLKGYTRSFTYIYQVVDDVIKQGIDPDVYLTWKGRVMKNKISDYIVA